MVHKRECGGLYSIVRRAQPPNASIRHGIVCKPRNVSRKLLDSDLQHGPLFQRQAPQHLSHIGELHGLANDLRYTHAMIVFGLFVWCLTSTTVDFAFELWRHFHSSLFVA